MVVAEARVYRNGVAVGTVRSTPAAKFIEDISGWSPGDLVQVYGRYVSGGSSNLYAAISQLTISVAGFTQAGDIIA